MQFVIKYKKINGETVVKPVEADTQLQAIRSLKDCKVILTISGGPVVKKPVKKKTPGLSRRVNRFYSLEAAKEYLRILKNV